MDTKIQLHIPSVDGVPIALRLRKVPQPKITGFKALKKFEILHRPFDLKFKGRVNKWLRNLEEMEYSFEDNLERLELRLIKLYFFPRNTDNKWLSQKEVIEKLKLNPKKRLRSTLVNVLQKIWLSSKHE